MENTEIDPGIRKRRQFGECHLQRLFNIIMMPELALCEGKVVVVVGGTASRCLKKGLKTEDAVLNE